MGKAIVVPDTIFNGVGTKGKVTTSNWAFNGYEFENYPMSHTFHQGVAIYGDYAIHFDNNSEYFFVFDIRNKRQVYSANFQTADANRHGNTLNFGTKKYSEEDEFPLLYGSGNEASLPATDIIKTIDVYRVQRDGNTWSVTKVQVIDFSNTPVTYTNASFHGDNLLLTRGSLLSEYRCPNVNEGNTYSLTTNDLVKEYNNPYTYNFYPLIQGETCVGNYHFMINSHYDTNVFRHFLEVYDLSKEKIVGHYFISDTDEIQQIAYWKNEDKYIMFHRQGVNSKIINFVRNT